VAALSGAAIRPRTYSAISIVRGFGYTRSILASFSAVAISSTLATTLTSAWTVDTTSNGKSSMRRWAIPCSKNISRRSVTSTSPVPPSTRPCAMYSISSPSGSTSGSFASSRRSSHRVPESSFESIAYATRASMSTAITTGSL
jgi:hypothetical protein